MAGFAQISSDRVSVYFSCAITRTIMTARAGAILACHFAVIEHIHNPVCDVVASATVQSCRDMGGCFSSGDYAVVATLTSA